MDIQKYLDWINSKSENFEYYSPAPLLNGTPCLPISAMGGRNLNDQNVPYSRSELDEITDCGFNVLMAGWLSVGGAASSTLSNAHDNENIKILFKNGKFVASEDSDYETVMVSVKNFIAEFGGTTTIKDEPSYKEMIGEKGDVLDQYFNIMSRDPNFLVYINVAAGGEYFLDGISGNSEKERYRKYLETFQNYFKPSLFSYDGYPIEEVINLLYEGMTNEEGLPLYRNLPEGKIIVDSDGYYKRLEMFNEISSNNKRPFYAFCQSVNLMHLDINKYRPVALEQYLRYEAFSALAFGAKGIVYWKYAPGENNDSEAYISALLDWRGNKTLSWYFAQKVNNEIHKYEDLFLYGDFLEQTIVSNYSFNLNIFTRLRITSEDNTALLISRISYGPNMYFIVVNTDPLNYHNIIVNISTGTGVEVTPVTSTGKGWTALFNGNNPRIMIPGGYRIFYIMKEEL